MKNITALFAAILLFIPILAFANEDAGLYDPVVPEDAALVRFIYLNEGEVSTSINGKSYDNIGGKEISPYYVVDAGKVSLDIGGAVLEGAVLSGKSYSLIKYGAKEVFLEDFRNENKAKSQVALYNFTDGKTLSLQVVLKGDKKIEAISQIAPEHVGFRSLKPVKVEFAVFKGDEQLGEKIEVIMERDRTYNFIATDDNVFMAVSTTDTTK